MPPYSFLLTQNQWRTDTKKDLVQLFKPPPLVLGKLQVQDTRLRRGYLNFCEVAVLSPMSKMNTTS